MGEKVEDGWKWPPNSRKAHFFRGSMSLCHNWMYSGPNTGNQEGGSPDDCKTCSRMRASELKKFGELLPK